MQKYLQYIKAQFLEGLYRPPNIINIDETTFTLIWWVGELSLADRGAKTASKTISVCTNVGSSSMLSTEFLVFPGLSRLIGTWYHDSSV